MPEMYNLHHFTGYDEVFNTEESTKKQKTLAISVDHGPTSISHQIVSAESRRLVNMQLNVINNLISFRCADRCSAWKVVMHHPGFWAPCTLIISTVAIMKPHCAQKPGWRITTVHAGYQCVLQNEWRFLMMLSCIFLNRQLFAEIVSELSGLRQWSMLITDIFYFFGKFLCAQNLICQVR